MRSRRGLIQAGGAALLAASIAPGAKAAPAMVSGPISGGGKGRPFGGFLGDLRALGYVEGEYVLRGEATAYQAVGALGADGRWTVTPADSAGYVTRILVRRPRSATAFNGTVIVEWANVSTGFDVAFCDPPAVYQGFAHVLVSAQRAGVHGFPGPAAAGLLQWDGERYAGLSIPADSLSFDIFTQAARAVGPRRRRGPVDPMGGLKVSKLVAIGASQSGGRLMSYINGVQPRERVFDAILPLICAGAGVGFDDPPGGRGQPVFTRVRDDLDTPVMPMNSESEALYYFPLRQPDSRRFVYWEVAGSSHICTARLAYERRLMARDGVTMRWHPGPADGDLRASDVDWSPALEAALGHVQRWIHGGPPPPSQPKMAIAGAKPAFVRDADGNVLAGVRLPDMDAPIARYEGSGDGVRRLLGRTEPLAPKRLAELYPTHADYVAKVEAAARAAVDRGVIGSARARQYVEAARRAPIPS